MTPMTVEHLILGVSLGSLIVLEIAIGAVAISRITARLDRTLRVLGSLIVQESGKVQAVLRD